MDDVSLQVAEGSIQGIIGPNGAGKTTMFNLVAGAIRPRAGTVHLDGTRHHRAARRTASAAAGMARTFQLMRPFGSMSVLENVAVAAMAAGTSRRRRRPRSPRTSIERVGISEVA